MQIYVDTHIHSNVYIYIYTYAYMCFLDKELHFLNPLGFKNKFYQ